jgi:hypothetical protein
MNRFQTLLSISTACVLRYTQDFHASEWGAYRVKVGRCRLPVSKPVLKAPMVSALETGLSLNAFKCCFQSQFAPLHQGLQWFISRAQRHARQGLTLVHFSAQPQPFSSHLPVSPCLTDWRKIMHPTYPTKCAYVEPKSGRVSAPDVRHRVHVPPEGRHQLVRASRARNTPTLTKQTEPHIFAKHYNNAQSIFPSLRTCA